MSRSTPAWAASVSPGWGDAARLGSEDVILACLTEKRGPRGTLPADLVRAAHRLVTRSEVPDAIGRWRDQERVAAHDGREEVGGRPPGLGDMTILTVLVTLAVCGEPLLIARVTEAIRYRLDPASRALLGLPTVEPNASDDARYHQVRRAVKRSLEPVDPYPGVAGQRMSRQQFAARMAALDPEAVDRRLHRLRWVCNRLLAASSELVPRRVRRQWRGNVVLDATAMPVWGRRGSTSRFKDDGTETAVSPEPLAGWYARSTETHQDPSDGGRPKVYQATWAYECHIAVACASKAGDDDFPMLALAMTLDAPAGRVGQNGAALLAGVAEQGHPIGLAVSDRAYMPGAKPETFQLPARALGYRLVMDYKTTELGLQATRNGALLVEGSWYCPAIPKHLVDATSAYNTDLTAARKAQSPDVREEAVVAAMRTYVERIAQRGRYLLQPKDKKASGTTRWACPATGNHPTLSCPLRPTMPSPGRAGAPTRALTKVFTAPELLGAICTNTTAASFPITAGAKHTQAIPYHSASWYQVYGHARATMEGLNGVVKNGGAHALADPARRRARGYAYQTLAAALTLLATNLAKIRAWNTRHAPDRPQPRRPRTRPVDDIRNYLPTIKPSANGNDDDVGDPPGAEPDLN